MTTDSKALQAALAETLAAQLGSPLQINRLQQIPGGASKETWQLEIEVADTGIGIASENLPSLFQPLFSTKGSRGTGLGLASVHDMVTRQGGRVEVTSQVGCGSQFRVIFPGQAILSCNPQLPDPDPDPDPEI